MLYWPLGNNCVLIGLAGFVTAQTWNAPAFVPSSIETPVPDEQVAAVRFYSQTRKLSKLIGSAAKSKKKKKNCYNRFCFATALLVDVSYN